MVDAVNSAAMLERMKAEFIEKNAAALRELDEKCEASEAALASLADQIASGAQPPPEWQPADAASEDEDDEDEDESEDEDDDTPSSPELEAARELQQRLEQPRWKQ